MGHRLLLALALAATSFQVRGAEPPAPAPRSPSPSGQFAASDSAYAEALETIKALTDCSKRSARLERDLADKEAGLKKEFGTTPKTFEPLLDMKRKRLFRQQQVCITLLPKPGALLARARDQLRAAEPKTHPGIAPRLKKIDAAQARYNQLQADSLQHKK